MKPIAVFDIDGTIFRSSLLIELHWKLVRRGLIPRASIKKLDDAYWAWVKRQGNYDDYLDEVVVNFIEHIKGKGEREVREAAARVLEVQSKIVYRYTRDFIQELRGTHTLLAISGSPSIVVEEFAKEWGFEHFIGTVYGIENKEYTGEVLSTPVHDKKQALQDLVREHGLTFENSIAVGDTESDVGMFELVSEPICFNPTAGLYKIASERGWFIVVERKDQIYKFQKGKVVE